MVVTLILENLLKFVLNLNHSIWDRGVIIHYFSEAELWDFLVFVVKFRFLWDFQGMKQLCGQKKTKPKITSTVSASSIDVKSENLV